MQQNDRTQKSLDEKIDAICNKPRLSLPILQRHFAIRFSTAGELVDGASELGLVEANAHDIGYKILDAAGLKKYLHEHLPAAQGNVKELAQIKKLLKASDAEMLAARQK